MSTLGTTSPPFLLVTGGKGGVGKTTVTANLGIELARAGSQPVAVDLDFGLADLAVVLKLSPEKHVEHFLSGDQPLSNCLTDAPEGLRVLAAGSEARDAGRDGGRRRRLLEALRDPVEQAGLLVGDSPAGIGPDVLEFAAEADRVLLVTTPEPAALTDAYSVVKAVDAHARERGIEVPTPDVFVNLATDAAEARAVVGRLRSVCERFLCRSPRLLGWMPRSRSVLNASARQEPFVLSDPKSLAARSIRQLAKRFSDLATRSGAASLVSQGGSFHDR